MSHINAFTLYNQQKWKSIIAIIFEKRQEMKAAKKFELQHDTNKKIQSISRNNIKTKLKIYLFSIIIEKA